MIFFHIKRIFFNKKFIKKLFKKLLKNNNYYLKVKKRAIRISNKLFLNSNINYDKNLFYSITKSVLNKDYKLMTKDQLKSFIIIDCHRLEKGLSLKHPKPNFGLDVRNRLYKMNEIFLNRFGFDNVLIMIYDCLEEYKHWHLDQSLEFNSKEIDDYLKEYSFIKQNDSYKHGGTIAITKEEIIQSLQSFTEGITSRRSIRTFSKKPISQDILENCINRAIKGTPTVCNRPINKVYVVKDLKKRETLLKYQNGNRGYGIDAPVLLIITSRLSYFQDDRERRSPYIGGGMFAMSLAYSFHSEGLGTCCLNMDTDYKNDIKVRQILDATKETIIMFMLVGNYEEKFKIAYSHKPNLREVLEII